MTNKNWANEYLLNAKNLEDLFDNKISCIRVPNFASKNECTLLSNEIKKSEFDFYQDFEPPIGKLGVTQYDGIMKGKEWYFNHVEASTKLQSELFLKSFNPIERFFNHLSNSSSFDLVIPQEPNYGEYFAGVIRDINQTVRIHADFAVFDAPGWLISNISSQLTWNLYCDLPKYGGECIIYNHAWDIEEDKKVCLKTYQYNLDPLKDCEAKVIKPIVGDLYIFNSRNFHEVTMASSNRLSISSFIGKDHNQNKLLFWS